MYCTACVVHSERDIIIIVDNRAINTVMIFIALCSSILIGQLQKAWLIISIDLSKGEAWGHVVEERSKES